MPEQFQADTRELSKAEQAHLKAVRSIANQMYGVLKGDSPDPDCMREAIKKLEECVMWGEKAIRKGVHL